MGSYIATVTASDMDSGPQGEVSFSIAGGNIGNKFTINATSGEVKTIASLDRETTATFTLVIRASDGAVAEKVRYTDARLVVTIMDINDNAPSFAGAPCVAVSVPENTGVGDVASRIAANDIDAGTNSELRYTIVSGNEDGYFGIDPNTGDLRVNRSLDMEQVPLPDLEHFLVLNARDLGTPVSYNTTVQVNITITTVNEFTPQLQHADTFNFSYPENADPGKGVLVVDVNATDGDYGIHGDVIYKIASGKLHNEKRHHVIKFR